MVSIGETGAPTDNANGGNLDGRRGWLWVLMTPVLTVFVLGLSRSVAAVVEILRIAFAGTVVSDRFSAYNPLPTEQRQLCWVHLIRDLTAIAKRPGAGGEIGGALSPTPPGIRAHADEATAVRILLPGRIAKGDVVRSVMILPP